MAKKEKILRLLPKRRKGILRIIFSRTFIIFILIVLQIDIFLSLYKWFSSLIPHYVAFQGVFSIGMVIFLTNKDMDYSAKLTWLTVIMLFPVPGTILLWFTNKDIGHRAVNARIEYLKRETHGKLTQNEEILSEPEIIASGTAEISRYINLTGCFPVYRNTAVKYFPIGEAKYAALMEELEKAEQFIFMEYFIIDEGYMWGSILEVLARKAKLGVEIRVMYDGMCEISTLSHDYPERMKKYGIKCKAFSPIQPFISTHYNYRDHRKILVIDGKVAFNGGVNLADEYINRGERFGHWKDTAVMIKGEAVRSFTLMFLQMWNITEKYPQWNQWLDYPYDEYPDSKGYVMPYADCPLDGYRVGETVYIDILYRARKYVYIMTPYLILDGELEAALKYAAQRGVDVRLILPGIPDKRSANALAHTHYYPLISAGVQIYEYTPGFVHAKVFVSDDCRAVVGTINLDYRSLYHHFECATYMDNTDCIPDIKEDFFLTLEKCRQIDKDAARKEKLSVRIRGGLMKLIAPLI